MPNTKPKLNLSYSDNEPTVTPKPNRGSQGGLKLVLNYSDGTPSKRSSPNNQPQGTNLSSNNSVPTNDNYTQDDLVNEVRSGDTVGANNFLPPGQTNWSPLQNLTQKNGYKPSLAEQSLNVPDMQMPTVTTTANRYKLPIIKQPAMTAEDFAQNKALNIPQQGMVNAGDISKQKQLQGVSNLVQKMGDPLAAVRQGVESGVEQAKKGLKQYLQSGFNQKEKGLSDKTFGIVKLKPGQIEGLGNIASGGFKTAMSLYPELAVANIAASYISPISENIGSQIGGDKGKKIAGIITQVGTISPMGLPMVMGMIANIGGEELADKILVGSKLTEGQKALLKEAAGQIGFFAGAMGSGVGEKIFDSIKESTKQTPQNAAPQDAGNVAQVGPEGTGAEKLTDLPQEQSINQSTPVNNAQPSAQPISADPKSRVVVNILQREFDQAVKDKKPFDDKQIISQINNVIDPKEKIRLEQLYSKSLEHNKQLKEAKNATPKGQEPQSPLNERTGDTGQVQTDGNDRNVSSGVDAGSTGAGQRNSIQQGQGEETSAQEVNPQISPREQAIKNVRDYFAMKDEPQTNEVQPLPNESNNQNVDVNKKVVEAEKVTKQPLPQTKETTSRLERLQSDADKLEKKSEKQGLSSSEVNQLGYLQRAIQEEQAKNSKQGELSGKSGGVKQTQDQEATSKIQKPAEKYIQVDETKDKVNPEVDNNKSAAMGMFDRGKKDTEVLTALGMDKTSENMQQIRDWRKESRKANEDISPENKKIIDNVKKPKSGKVPQTWQEAILQYLVQGGKVKDDAEEYSPKRLREMGLSNRNISSKGTPLDLLLTQLGFGDYAYKNGLSQSELVRELLDKYPDHASRAKALKEMQSDVPQEFNNPELDAKYEKQKSDYNKLDNVILSQYLDVDGNLRHNEIIKNSENISKETGVDEGTILKYLREKEYEKPEPTEDYFADYINNKEITNGRAKEIVETSNPEEYDKLAKDIEGKANSDSETKLNEAVSQADEVIKPSEDFKLTPDEVKQKKSKPAEQIKMEGLGQTKVPTSFIKGSEADKGTEGSPLFEQKTKDKNQGNIFDQSVKEPNLGYEKENNISNSQGEPQGQEVRGGDKVPAEETPEENKVRYDLFNLQKVSRDRSLANDVIGKKYYADNKVYDLSKLDHTIYKFAKIGEKIPLEDLRNAELPPESKNTIFTKEKYDQNKAKVSKFIKDMPNQRGSGVNLPPEIIKALAEIGGFHVEKGIRDFTEWSKKMIEDVPELTKELLKDIWDNVKPKPEEKVNEETPKKPAGIAKAAWDINSKMVKKGMEELPEDQLARYTPITKADQVERVTNKLNSDYEKAKAMASGEEKIPPDIHPQVLFNAVKNKAIEENDIDTLRKLALSPLATERSLAAQTLSAAGFNNGEKADPVKAMRDVIDSREKSFGRQAETKRLGEYEKRIKVLEDRIQQKDDQLKKIESERVFKKIKRDTDFQTRRERRTYTKEQLREERGKLYKDLYKEVSTTLNAGVPITGKGLKILGELVKNYAQEGLVSAESVVDAIHNELKDKIEGITPRDIRDAISRYGQELTTKTRTQLQKDVQDLRSQMRTISQIEDLESGKEPIKNRVEKGQPSENLQRLKTKLKELQDEQKRNTGPDKLLNQKIKQIEKSIEVTKQKIVGTYTPPEKKTIPLDEKGTALQNELGDLRQQLKTKLDEHGITDQKNLSRSKELVKKKILEYTDKINKGEYSKEEKKVTPIDDEKAKLQSQLDDVRKRWNYIRESLGEVLSKEEAKNITDLSQSVSETKAKMDSAPRRKLGKPPTPEELEYGKARVAFAEYIDHLKASAKKLTWQEFKKNPVKISLESLKHIPGMTKSLKATLDNSGLFNQNMPVLMTHPTIWARNALKSFQDIARTIGGKNMYDELSADIVSRPYYEDMVNKDHVAVGVIEEAFPDSKILEKIPFFGSKLHKAADVAFTGLAYRNRADLYGLLTEAAKKGGNEVTTGLGIDKVVNSLTGRGNLGGLERAGNTVNVLLFAPRFVKSHLDVLTMNAFDSGISPFARKQAALNLMKIIGSISAVTVAANAIRPGSVETDPRSTDFMKIKVGDTRFNFTGGLGSIVTLAARLSPLLVGQESYTKNPEGKLMPINSGKYGSQTGWDVLLNFMSGKLAPVAGVARDLFRGQDFSGNRITLGNELQNLTVPLPITNVQEFLNDPKSANVIAGELADALGIFTNTYSNDPDLRKVKNTLLRADKEKLSGQARSNFFNSLDKALENKAITPSQAEQYKEQFIDFQKTAKIPDKETSKKGSLTRRTLSRRMGRTILKRGEPYGQ